MLWYCWGIELKDERGQIGWIPGIRREAGRKTVFSLSSVILFNMIGVDSCVFLSLRHELTQTKEMNTASDPFTTGVHSKMKV